MTCTPCNGTGLVDKTENGVVFGQEVCLTCKGIGHDGTVTSEAEQPKAKTSIFKSKKK